MNEQLQQARQAMESGNRAQSQIILAKLLKTEPNNSDAWFLLSEMAVSDEQRTAFLRRVLALNPNHAQAKQKLAEIESPLPVQPIVEPAVVPAGTPPKGSPEPVSEIVPQAAQTAPAGLPISTTPLDFDAQSLGNTIPPWLANEVQDLRPNAATPGVAVSPIEPAKPVADLPEWLKNQPDENWMAHEQPDKGKVVWKAGDGNEDLKPDKPTPPQAKPEKPKAKQPSARNDTLLILLIGLAVLVFIALIVAIFTPIL